MQGAQLKSSRMQTIDFQLRRNELQYNNTTKSYDGDQENTTTTRSTTIDDQDQDVGLLFDYDDDDETILCGGSWLSALLYRYGYFRDCGGCLMMLVALYTAVFVVISFFFCSTAMLALVVDLMVYFFFCFLFQTDRSDVFFHRFFDY